MGSSPIVFQKEYNLIGRVFACRAKSYEFKSRYSRHEGSLKVEHLSPKQIMKVQVLSLPYKYSRIAQW